jgi:hypothetical protein
MDSNSRKKEIDAQLRELCAGKKCPRHKRLTAKFGILWADGRAFTYACNKPCYLKWKKSQGEMACVVRVAPVNRGK